jgi:hypothetical protein
MIGASEVKILGRIWQKQKVMTVKTTTATSISRVRF